MGGNRVFARAGNDLLPPTKLFGVEINFGLRLLKRLLGLILNKGPVVGGILADAGLTSVKVAHKIRLVSGGSVV